MATISVNMNTSEAIAKIRSYGMAARGRLKDHVSNTALIVERKAKKLCPIDQNRLRSSIRLMDMSFDGFGAEVGTDVHYAPHVEYGTAAHVIRAKGAGLSNKKGSPKSIAATGGPAFFGKEVNHPGTRAQPFMLPAAEGARNGWLKGIKEILRNVK